MPKLHYRFMIIYVLMFLLILSGCSRTQAEKTFTVGIINITPNLDDIIEAFQEGMTDLDYIEGKNIAYIYEGVVEDLSQLDKKARNLVDLNVDLILSLTTPATQAVKRATEGTDIPIVFIPVTDPVGAGVVKSLKNPGGNITGITYSTQEGLRLEWLIQVVPSIEQVYIVYNPEDQSPVFSLGKVKEAASIIGVELLIKEALNIEEVTKAFENIPEEADAIFFLPDSLTNTHIDYLLKVAIEHKLPTSGSNTNLVDDGALTTFGINLPVSARKDAARLADLILKGASPSDLPVETAEFFSAINLKTAELIGVNISDDILRQTDIIIR